MVDESVTDDGGGTLDLRKVESEIRGIKGIGEKRVEEIILIFELRFMICASAVFRNDYAQSTISGWLIVYKMVINTI